MRLSPRFLMSLATGGMLLALPAPYLVVHAEPTTAPAPAPENKAQTQPTVPSESPAAPPSATPKAEAPTPAPAQPAPMQPAPAHKAEPKPEATPPAPSAAAGDKSQLPTPTVEEEPVSTEEELRFVELVNEERAKRGLNRLRIDPMLIRVARLHSAEMRDKAYFSHESPTSGIKTPLDRYLRACSSRPTYACVGENLFWATVIDVQRGHQAFMNSPTHRENVLFPRYEKIGVGVIKRGNEFWVTQMFLTNTDPVSVARNRMK